MTEIHLSAAAGTDLRLLVEQFPTPLALLEGSEHRYAAASEAYRRLVGRGDLIGRSISEVLPELEPQGLLARLREAWESGNPASGHAVRLHLSDGSGPPREHFVDFLYLPLRGSDGSPSVIAVKVTDVTEHVRSAGEQKLLMEAAEILASSLDFDETLASVANLAVPEIADWCAIDEVTPAGELRRIAVAHPDPAMVALAHELQERYPPDPNAPHGVHQVLRTGTPEMVPEIPDELLVAAARDEEHLRIIRALTLRSYIVVPLIARGAVLGALSLVSSRPERRYGERDLRIAQELARRGAVAIDNARLYRDALEAREMAQQQAAELEMQTQELQTQAAHLEDVQVELEAANDDLQRSNRELSERSREAQHAMERLEVIAEAGAKLTAALDVRAALEELARLVVPRLADWCFVEMLDDDGSISPLAVHHADPARRAMVEDALRRYPVDPSADFGTARVLRTGEPEVVPEIPDEFLDAAARDETHRRILNDVGFRSFVSVPLAARGRTLGVLSLVMAGSGRRFGPDDVPYVQELARRGAVALESSRLYRAEQEARRAAEYAADRSRQLYEIAAALNECTTPEQVAAVCVGRGMAAIEADEGSLAVLVDDGTAFEVVHSSYPTAVAERWRRFGRVPGRPLTDALEQGQPVLVGTREEWVARYPASLEATEQAGVIGFAALPMVSRHRPMAALSFGFRTEQRFTDTDRTFLATLAQQASQALERAQLFAAEHSARTEAEAANRSKTEFLSAMSHELRTPLNAIAGYVDLLDLGVRGSLNDGQREYVARIRKAEEVLLGLISDILNFARIESGHMDYRQERVPLDPLLADLEEMMHVQVSAKGLSYGWASGAGDLAARGDPERIRQILINLLTNAVKFTDPGGRIRVRAEVRDGCAMVRVRDTGRGIPPDKVDAVFEPFVQLGRRDARESQQGVGLGLAIGREMARAMAGDLTVKTAEGEGSTFTLTLPLADDAGEPR